MDDEIESIAVGLRALGNPKRLAIMRWLIDPTRHFPPQVDGDLVDDGVCVGFITKKVGLSQPAVTEHMQVLSEAGLVTSKKIKNWVFYRVNRSEITALVASLGSSLEVSTDGEELRQKA